MDLVFAAGLLGAVTVPIALLRIQIAHTPDDGWTLQEGLQALQYLFLGASAAAGAITAAGGIDFAQRNTADKVVFFVSVGVVVACLGVALCRGATKELTERQHKRDTTNNGEKHAHAEKGFS